MEKASTLDSKMYVLDTNVLLHEPLAYLSFQEHDVVIPMTVLEELDHIKDRKHDVSRDARVAIRGLDEILKDASPEQMLQGVALPSNKKVRAASTGRLIIVNDHLFADSISGLPGNENDHRI
ncbi:MAG: PIN domain-containing protein, partial [Pseudoalteromonas sp.]